MNTLLTSLYDYGVWADARLLAQADQLTAAQLHQPWSTGYPSILDTFAHQCSGDWRWYARWQEQAALPMLTGRDLESLEAIRAKWAALIPERRTYIASLNDAQLNAVIHWTRDGQAFALPRWQAMLHCANHGAQHRAELAAMLTAAGHSPGEMGYLLYCTTLER